MNSRASGPSQHVQARGSRSLRDFPGNSRSNKRLEVKAHRSQREQEPGSETVNGTGRGTPCPAAGTANERPPCRRLGALRAQGLSSTALATFPPTDEHTEARERRSLAEGHCRPAVQGPWGLALKIHVPCTRSPASRFSQMSSKPFCWMNLLAQTGSSLRLNICTGSAPLLCMLCGILVCLFEYIPFFCGDDRQRALSAPADARVSLSDSEK